MDLTVEFKGKKKDYSNTWVTGDLTRYLNGQLIINTDKWVIEDEEIRNTYIMEGAEVFNESVGMFTGNTDKDGVKIYGGDMYREDFDDTHATVYFVCTWLKEFGCFSWLDLDTYSNYIENGVNALDEMLNDGIPLHIDYEESQKIKIISNVYDWDFTLNRPKASYDYSNGYDKVGNNKLGIKPTGRSYGLLFR